MFTRLQPRSSGIANLRESSKKTEGRRKELRVAPGSRAGMLGFPAPARPRVPGSNSKSRDASGAYYTLKEKADRPLLSPEVGRSAEIGRRVGVGRRRVYGLCVARGSTRR